MLTLAIVPAAERACARGSRTSSSTRRRAASVRDVRSSSAALELAVDAGATSRRPHLAAVAGVRPAALRDDGLRGADDDRLPKAAARLVPPSRCRDPTTRRHAALRATPRSRGPRGSSPGHLAGARRDPPVPPVLARQRRFSRCAWTGASRGRVPRRDARVPRRRAAADERARLGRVGRGERRAGGGRDVLVAGARRRRPRRRRGDAHRALRALARADARGCAAAALAVAVDDRRRRAPRGRRRRLGASRRSSPRSWPGARRGTGRDAREPAPGAVRRDRRATSPASPAGSSVATVDELELAERWYARLHRGGRRRAPARRDDDDRAMLPRRCARAGLRWWRRRRRIVSMAGHAVPVATPVGVVTRVGPVYTPPARRGRGYAAALTGRLTELLLGTRVGRSCSTPTRRTRRATACTGGLGYERRRRARPHPARRRHLTPAVVGPHR